MIQFPPGTRNLIAMTVFASVLAFLWLNQLVATLLLPTLVAPAFLTIALTSAATILVSALTASASASPNDNERRRLATTRYVFLNAAGTTVGIVTALADAIARPDADIQNGLGVMLSPFLSGAELRWIWIVAQAGLFVWACWLIRRGTEMLSLNASASEAEMERAAGLSLTLLIIWIVTCLRWQGLEGSEFVATVWSAILYGVFAVLAVWFYAKVGLKLFQTVALGVAEAGWEALRILFSRKTWLIVLVSLMIATVAAAAATAAFFAIYALCEAVRLLLLFGTTEDLWSALAKALSVSESVLRALAVWMAGATVVASLFYGARFTNRIATWGGSMIVMVLAWRPDWRHFSKAGSALAAIGSWAFAFLTRHRKAVAGTVSTGLAIVIAVFTGAYLVSGPAEPDFRVDPADEIVPASVILEVEPEVVEVRATSLCQPAVGAINWTYELTDEVTVDLQDCMPAAISPGEAVIAVGLASHGSELADEEARATHRAESLAAWLERRLPQGTAIYTLDLGMGLDPSAHMALTNAFGATWSERPLLGLVVSRSDNVALPWHREMSAVRYGLLSQYPEIERSYSKFELSEW